MTPLEMYYEMLEEHRRMRTDYWMNLIYEMVVVKRDSLVPVESLKNTEEDL